MRDQILFEAGTTQTTNANSAAFDLQGMKGYAIQSVWDVTTPAAKTFTADAGTDLLTTATHGYATGLKGQVSTDGVLPAGLAAVTDYYVIASAAGTYKLASSYANALAGTAVDVTDAGTGTHTFTPTALSASVKLQASVNGTTWEDVSGTSTNITADSNVMWNVADAFYPFVRQALTIAAGQLTLATRAFAKG